MQFLLKSASHNLIQKEGILYIHIKTLPISFLHSTYLAKNVRFNVKPTKGALNQIPNDMKVGEISFSIYDFG